VIHPKDMYRNLAALLGEIDSASDDADYLLSVLARIGTSFTRDLHIANGRLYGQLEQHFMPVARSAMEPAGSAEKRPFDAEAASLVVQHGTYVYSGPAWSRLSLNSVRQTTVAAFAVKDEIRLWIFVFELDEGWIREEIEFCFNAIRSQLNFRLRINAMNGAVEQAALIQLSLLPSTPPFIAGYQTAARCQPAGLIGGDFFDFSVLDDEFFTVAVGDAMGHGLPAALLVRDVVTGLRMGVEKEMKMAEAMQKLNRVIHRSTLSSNFASLFFAEIDNWGNIRYVNAGHPPPILIHGSQARHLLSTGTILGALSEAQFRRASATLEPDGVLLLYSDGVIERRRDTEEFGLLRLEELAIRHREENAMAILNRMFQAITEWGNPPAFQDDVTLVVIKKSPYGA